MFYNEKNLFPCATEFEEQLVSKKSLCCAGHHKLRWSESSRSCARILEPPEPDTEQQFLALLLAASEYTVHARMNRHRSSPPELNPVSASLQAYRAYITELISLVTVP